MQETRLFAPEIHLATNGHRRKRGMLGSLLRLQDGYETEATVQIGLLRMDAVQHSEFR